MKCYSGRTYADRPLRFDYQGAEYEVVKITREWHEPDAKHFLVTTVDGALFELMYSGDDDTWSVRPQPQTQGVDG